MLFVVDCCLWCVDVVGWLLFVVVRVGRWLYFDHCSLCVFVVRRFMLAVVCCMLIVACCVVRVSLRLFIIVSSLVIVVGVRS